MVHLRLALLLILAMAMSGELFGQGAGTGTPAVIVTLGKPNVWTMEQAHYLLEKNRAHDLGIAAQDLGPLDANEIVGYRLDAVKTLLSAQVQFDAATGAKNTAALSQYNLDMLRYNLLRNQQDRLRGEQSALANQLASAQYQLTVLQDQNPQDPRKIQLQQAEIARITGAKAGVDAEANSLSQSIGSEPSLSSLTSTVPTPDEASQSAIGTNQTFTQMLSGIPQGLNNSKTQASIKLDNYINLQYEIVAKQLTLLRDEAGPKNQVVFVELPQSIYVTEKFKYLLPDLPALLGAHLVQTWWHITQVVTAEGPSDSGRETQSIRPPAAGELADVAATMREQIIDPKTKLTHELALNGAFALKLGSFLGLKQEDLKEKERSEPECSGERRSPEEILCTWARDWKFDSIPITKNDLRGRAYALDLIPRQSALNVAEAHSVSRAYGFAGLFGLLSGLGGKARYERQRDQYDQFVQQEAFASAFGKGEEEFGWTFGPLPGTKRMAPGIRTTYAVVVVPKSARVIRLEGIGCGYRRRRVPKDPFLFPDGGTNEACGQRVTYDLDVPDGADSFGIAGVSYRPTQAGQRISVELEGTFDTQLGILVNGTPLQKVVSLGQPTLEQTAFSVPANAGESGIQGVYELVGTKNVLMSFVMPASFVGTPRIALITPAREAVINDSSLLISDGASQRGLRLLDKALPMFYQQLNIARLTADYSHATSRAVANGETPSVLLQFFGQGFQPANVDPVGSPPQYANSLLVNGFVLNPQTPLDLTQPLDIGEYRVLNSGAMQARIERKKYFPHYEGTFMQHDRAQTLQSTASLDDDGPPDPQSCTIKSITDGKVKIVNITLKGEFFTQAYPPTSNNDNLTIGSSALSGTEEWYIVGTPGNSLMQGVLTLKGSNLLDSPQVALTTCTKQ